MLRIRTVTDASAAKSYYSEADYYSQGQETIGKWGGKLAGMLGLSGPVDKAQFDHLCDNIHPFTGESLTPRTNDNRRVGYDMVYAGPKSFSVLVGLGPEDVSRQLRAIFDSAVSDTQAMVEADMQTRVRIGGALHDRPTGNMLWAEFDHSTSRPVDGMAPDPHWHKHVFCLNATGDTEEGRIKAGEFARILRDKAFYEAAFFSRLAKGLADSGYAIERQADGRWEIAGVPQSVIDKFSKRTEEIEAAADRLGITDADSKGELGAKTRSKKQKELTPDQLRESWDGQLTDSERAALGKVIGQQIASGKDVTPAEAVTYALDHLSEKLSVVPEREVERVALLFGLGSVTQEQIADELPRHGVITADIDGRLMATTDKLQQEEDYLVAQTMGGRGNVKAVGVADGLTRTIKDGKLNDGQWNTVIGLLNSENRINLVEGPAGAGKSSLLAKYREGMERAGQPVTWLATTTDAAGVLARDGFKVDTVARFLLDERMQAGARGGWVVIDETSLLGHKDAVRLFEIAQKNDLKLIFVGDPMQHGAVARGALMRVLKDYGGIQPFKLTEILRQENPDYRAAAQLLSEGRTLEGFDSLDAMGRIEEIADSQDRYLHLAADYRQAVEDKKSVLVVSPTHAESNVITAAIRSVLRQAGKLGHEDHEFTRLVQVDRSEAERAQATSYRPGDVIQFHQNAKGGFTKGDRLIVTDPAAVPLEHAAKFSVYRPESIALAEGDRIRFTGNVKTLDGKHTLKNGMAHTVAGFTRNGNIRLENGWEVASSAGHFRHGFVETSFGSQGRTVQRVLLGMSASSIPAMNMEQIYVSASRAKEWIRLYTDDKAQIRDAVKRSSKKLAALDLPKRAKLKSETGHWDGLQHHMERRKKLRLIDRMRAAWDRVTGNRATQKERQADHGYGR